MARFGRRKPARCRRLYPTGECPAVDALPPSVHHYETGARRFAVMAAPTLSDHGGPSHRS